MYKMLVFSGEEVVCNNQIIETVVKFKYLGIIIDRYLKFDEHVRYLKGKVYAKMKTLGCVRQFVSQKMSLDMYTSLVVPHLDFGDVIYDAVSKTEAQTLQVPQNQCLRICLKANPRTSIEELHAAAGVPMLIDRRTEHTCNVEYRGVHGLLSQGVNNLYTTVAASHNVNTRNSANDLLEVPKVNLNISKGNIGHRGVVYHNTLPAEIRSANTAYSFKSRSQKHMRDRNK